MALVKHLIRSHVQIPHEPGEWMDLRPLTFMELDDAQMKGYVGMLKGVGEMEEVSATVVKIMAAQADAQAETAAATGDEEEGEVAAAVKRVEAEPDPLAGLDAYTVLCAGIVAWSYEDEVTPENIRLLDPETATWAAAEIVALKSKSDLEKASAPSMTP